jgi:hypothetical protein
MKNPHSYFGMSVLKTVYPKAYHRLPSSYRADPHALSFFFDEAGNLCAVLWDDQEAYLWVANQLKWVRIE